MKSYLFTLVFLLIIYTHAAAQNYPMVTPRNNPETTNTRSEPEIAVPQLTWEGVRQPVTTGERLTLTLRANNWNAPLASVPPSFFMPEVPQGVILAAQPVTAEERASGILIKLTLIPLVTGSFNLPARTLQHGNTRFEIPALHIRVTPK